MNYQNYPNYQQNYQQAYQPYYQQIQQLQNQIPQIQQQMPQQTQNSGIFFFVNSQKEVDEWVLNAGQTAFFFDRNNPIFYIKSVAQNGLSQPVEVYDYKQRETPVEAAKTDSIIDIEQFVTKDEFNALKSQIENMQNEHKPAKSAKKTEAE